jgi:putative transposase
MVYDVRQEFADGFSDIGIGRQEGIQSVFRISAPARSQRSNAIWQADHSLLDILLVCDDGGRHAKPWLTVVLDDYSRAVAGHFGIFSHLKI